MQATEPVVDLALSARILLHLLPESRLLPLLVEVLRFFTSFHAGSSQNVFGPCFALIRNRIMLKNVMLTLGLTVAAFVAVSANSQEKKEFKADCPVSGKPAKESIHADYKGGKVYFCCDGCPGPFAKDTAKFAVKANHQLVVTGQATQAKCPLTGGPLNAEKTVNVGGVKVQFCCEKCQGKVAAAKAEDQLGLVFSDAAFEKAFTVKK